MPTPFEAKGDIISKAVINCELTLPGISVKPPLKLPPSIIMGGNDKFSVEAFTPNFTREPISDPIGRLLRDGPQTSLWCPGIREHTAVIILRSEERRVGKECRSRWA